MPIQDPLTQQITGFSYRIANTLGRGFVEKVYENALAFEFRKAKIAFAQQQTVEVFYGGGKGWARQGRPHCRRSGHRRGQGHPGPERD